MKVARVSLIAAIGATTRVIGNDNKLVFHKIPGDMKWFKEKTMGHPVIMGRKTFESIGSKPLPGRLNVILTKNREFNASGCVTSQSIKGAITGAKRHDKEEIFVIGGGQIYSDTIKMADRLYLTLVYGDTPGDTFFPEYANSFRKIISYDMHPATDIFPFSYAFLVLEK